MDQHPLAGEPVAEWVVVRGPVEDAGAQGIKVAGRWFAYGRDRPAPVVGDLVEVEAEAGVIRRLVLLAAAAPNRAPAAPSPADAAGAEIAVAADDAAYRELVAGLLAREGYRVRPWAEWPPADAGQRTSPALLFLSLRGGQLARAQLLVDQLQADPATRAMPVIVQAPPGPSRDGFRRRPGIVLVDDPLDAEELLARVQAVLGEAPRRDGPAGTPPPGEPGATPDDAGYPLA